MTAPAFIAASVITFDDGETSGMVLHRGSRAECESVCDLLGAISVNDLRRIVDARLVVMPADEWDALCSGAEVLQ